MYISWAVFLLSAAVIVYAGTKLSRYGDQIADLTGLGGLWVGVVLRAAPFLAGSANEIAEQSGITATFIGPHSSE